MLQAILPEFVAYPQHLHALVGAPELPGLLHRGEGLREGHGIHPAPADGLDDLVRRAGGMVTYLNLWYGCHGSSRLCTKSPVREMTHWAMRPSRSVFKPIFKG